MSLSETIRAVARDIRTPEAALGLSVGLMAGAIALVIVLVMISR